MSKPLPEKFIESLADAKGFDKSAFLQVHQSGEQLTSVRLNPGKALPVQTHFQTGERIPWTEHGYYLPERPSFTLDPLFHAGAYYVQEASSMFLEEVMKQLLDLSLPLKVLDLCAAPGGKSTLIQSIISAESMLVSNEVIKSRVSILEENTSKWGAGNVIVTNNDPQHFQRLPAYFDVIVVDAPCSGSGLFRKDPAAIEEWSENNVQLCSQRQQRILSDIIPSLKPGGILIYSTCSYSKEEDEAIVQWIVENELMENISIRLDETWNIVESAENSRYSYRFYPDKVKGEGFFIAAFKKKRAAPLEGENAGFKKKKEEKKPAKDFSALDSWLKKDLPLSFIKIKEEVIALPVHLKNELPVLQTALYIKKAGIRAGTIIREMLIPGHDLAMSNILDENIPSVELDKITALQYLRREDIKIDTPFKGWVLVKFGGLPLGWIKVLPNRVNNYYPKEWRILMKV